MGPLGRGLVQTEPADAAAVGPFQIHQLGRFLALETYYDVASSQFVSAGGSADLVTQAAPATRL